jgi:hypothetical protein
MTESSTARAGEGVKAKTKTKTQTRRRRKAGGRGCAAGERREEEQRWQEEEEEEGGGGEEEERVGRVALAILAGTCAGAVCVQNNLFASRVGFTPLGTRSLLSLDTNKNWSKARE